jgi:hypothetical protein
VKPTAALLTLIALAVPLSAFAADQGKMPPENAPMPERWLSVDDDGWTVLKPAADSRLIYVSASEGDDETARPHTPRDPAVGDDPTNPAGPLKAFKTIGKAMAAARDRMPDWVLLRRGDTWRDVSLKTRDGRAPAEPSVVCAWGDGPRPVITGRTAAVALGGNKSGARNTVLADLVLYCSFLDPDAPDYGVEKAPEYKRHMARAGIGIPGGVREPGRNILVENCLTRFCGFSVTHPAVNVVIRRTTVLDKYPPAGHTMGLWGAYASLLLEECVFDHNGWLYQRVPETEGKPGRAIPLSHNTYCTGMYNTVFRGNIFTRAASIGNKFSANYGPGSSRNVIVENNLYVDGEIALSMGGNNPGPLRWLDCRFERNVILDLGLSRPTGRNLAWHIGALDWNGGRIAGNLFIHQRSEQLRNTHAVHLGAGGPNRRYPDAPVGRMRNLAVENNVIHGLYSTHAVFIITRPDRLENVTIRNNHLQQGLFKTPLMQVEGDELKGLTFQGNVYDSAADPAAWFAIGKEKMDFDVWVKAAGETGAAARKIDYADPARNIQAYMKHIGLTPTREAFIAEIRKQCRRRWRKDLTAPVINDWFRAGFTPK